MMGLDAIQSLRLMAITLAIRCHSGKTAFQAIALSSHSLFAALRIIRWQSIQRVHSGYC